MKLNFDCHHCIENEEILNGKLRFLCSACFISLQISMPKSYHKSYKKILPHLRSKNLANEHSSKISL